MSQLSVLIVEDEAILAAHLASNVKLLGYRVTGPVSTGEEALALAQAERPDIALLDIRLDGHMDGIQTATCLKQRREERGIRLEVRDTARASTCPWCGRTTAGSR
jgi:CheY-like chemotaxis protein